MDRGRSPLMMFSRAVVVATAMCLVGACSTGRSTDAVADGGIDAPTPGDDASLSDGGGDVDAALVDDGGTAFTMEGRIRCCLPGAGRACCADAKDGCFPFACAGQGGFVNGKPPCLHCCEGLHNIGNEEPTDDGDGGTICRAQIPGAICSNCGDGICADGENWCNCPADCSKPDGGS